MTTEGTTSKQQDETEIKVTAHMSKEQPGQRILLATALVDITSRAGQTHVFRALIDQGSEASFVTARVVDLLGLRRTNINGVVSGVGGEGRICINHMAELVVKSKCVSNFSVNIKAYVLKSLTRRLPAKEVKICGWPQLKSMKLADPHFHTPSRIDILLGADVFCKIIGSGLIRGPGDLVAQYTNLGWILSGSVSKSASSLPQITSLHVTRLDDETNNLLRKFWEIDVEHYRSKKILTKEETKCEEIYKNTTTRDETGRYVVQLPLRQSYEDTVRMCGDTKKLAITRLESLEKRFRKNERLKIAYKEVIHEYLRLGHMMRVEDENHEGAVYLAHHPVIREDKDTTKIRVVFDASAKGTGGFSLNDCMMIGPVLQPDLRSIIIRWRIHKFCVIGDIIKMYRQVRVTEDHANLQRIVWRNEESEEVKSYKLMTVTFGTAAAPYLAVRTLCQLAQEEAEYPETASVIKNSFYVDDLMSGNEDIDKTKVMCEEVKMILRKGGFEMQKWSSNCDEVLDFLQERECTMKEKLDIKLDKVIKTLGLTWDRKDDRFKITVNLPEVEGPLTKRSVLSDVARLFDPFGWLSPVVISAKILIQKLWICNLGWDDVLPPHLIEDWLRYRKELIHLQHISLPRWFNTTAQNLKDMEIHGFADASVNAYAAVVYLKVINNASIHVMIIASRTKVAPLKQISVPKLELCAAALLTELMSDVVDLLSIPKERIFAWSDSMVVLSWLQSEPSRWRTFVANRVAEITRVLDNNHWNYVQSSDNPADLATRGIKAHDLANQDIWWSGPDWLKQIQIEKDRLEIPQTELESKNAFHSYFEGEPIWQRFSSLSKMKRVLAYCRRLLPNKGKKEKFLTVDEMNLIETRCVKFYQGQMYRQEVECLKKDGRVRSGSSLANLTPYLDEHGLLRVAGRLNNAEFLSTNTKHPIIIPAKQHVTRLIINDGHAKTLHGGVLQTMAFIRRKFWVINL